MSHFPHPGVRRRLARALSIATIASVAIASLTGCAMIPRSGDVHEGVSAPANESDLIQFLPSGPADGASPQEILRGFVDAATSPRDDWGIAREFLTKTFSAEWKPTAGVLIDQGNRDVTQKALSGDAAEFVLDTSVYARVDESGNYADTPATRTQLSFGFALQGGQWRISSAPAGVLLDQSTFGQVFADQSLYFFDPSFERLVPDVRWFPARVSTSTRVIKALLSGPSSWLAQSDAVVSTIPPEAVLVADSVPVQDGTATVNFDIKSLRVDSLTSSRMLRQISASLSQVYGVDHVDMQFSGASEGGTAVPSSSSLLAPSAYSSAVVDTEERFGTYQAGSVVTLPRIGEAIHALRPQAVSVRMNLGVAAALTSSGLFSVFGDGQSVNVDARERLIAPAVDTRGFLWSVPRDEPAAVRVASTDGSSSEVVVSWAAADTISALSVSPDGTRVAVALGYREASRLCVAGITRSPDGVPVSLGPCLEPYVLVDNIQALGWADGERIAMLATPQSSTNPVTYLLTVGGRFTSLSTLSDGTVINGSGPTATLRLGTASGAVYEQASVSRWLLVASGVRLLATVN